MNRINYSKLVSVLVVFVLLSSAFSSFVFAQPDTLTASISATPGTVSVGDTITVTMAVTASDPDGSYNADDVYAYISNITYTGGAAVTLASSPTPNYQDIPDNGTRNFTWTYTATAAGTVSFTGYARDYRAGDDTYSNTATSNVATINPLIPNPSLNITSISATPSTVFEGQTITVTMNVNNNGNVDLSNVVPSSLTLNNPALATIASGPTPSSRNIDDGDTESFTWTYTANSAGTVNFTGYASTTYDPPGSDPPYSVTSTSSTSNDVTINAPCEHAITVNYGSSYLLDLSDISCLAGVDYRCESGSITDPICGDASRENSGRDIEYTPSGCCGTDTFFFIADDDDNNYEDIFVKVNVTINCTPDCTGNFTVNDGSYIDLTINGTTDFSCLGSGYRFYEYLSEPTCGNVELRNNTNSGDNRGYRTIRYTPTGCCGTDTFTFRARYRDDDDEPYIYKIVRANITINCAPDCENSFSVNCDSYKNIDFALISCISDNSNHYQSHTNPSHGSVSVISNRMIRYTPVSGYSGPDSFTFTAGGKTVQVNVTVTCNSPPIPDCTYYVDYDCATGDIIVDGTTYDYINVNDAARICYPTANYKGSVFLVNPNPGTAVFVGEGNQIDYSLTNCNGYCGQTDTLTFLADKVGAGGDIPDPITIKVILTIICPNRPPTAVDDSDSTNEDTCVDVNVTTNDTDPDNDSLTVLNFTDPAHGSVTDQGSGVLRYCPDDNWCGGTDTFDYNVSDGNGGTDIGTVSITVFCADNDPPVANDDETTIPEDTCIDVNVTTNDTDPEDDTLRVVWISEPSYGIVTLNDNNQSINYCPNLNYCGDDTFEYNVSDGQYTDKATVTIHILCENDPPVANDDYNTTDSITCIIIDVLANDIDPESNPLSASLVAEPAHGSLRFLGDTIGWEYCPDGNFCGIDTFTYVAYDGQLQSNVATVSIEIPCEEPILPNEKVPAALLYPLVDIERLTLTQGPVPLDGSIGAILDTGTNIIVDGKVIAVLETTSGSKTLVAQVDNLGFVTQNDVRLRFEGLPRGVSVSFLPESQQIKAHNVGTYVVTLTVSDNTPKGSYFVTAKAFTRSGTLDSEIFNLVIS